MTRRKIASTLSGALTRSGLTQAELARRLRVSQPRVSQILSGDKNLTVKSLARLARALGCTLTITLTPS